MGEEGGTADIEAGTTEAGTTEAVITDIATITPDIIATAEAGVGTPVDTIRGGCFRYPCLTRTTDITAPVTDTDMDTVRVTGTDTDPGGNGSAGRRWGVSAYPPMTTLSQRYFC